MKTLEINDKIQRIEFGIPVGSPYIILKVTKTLAKSETATFKREFTDINDIERKDDFWSPNKKYILINS